MTTSRLSAGATRFAHFAGFSRGARASAEDDGTNPGADDEKDDDDKSASRRGRASDDDEKKDDDDKSASRRGRASDDDEKKDDDDKSASRRGRASDDDEDDEDDNKEEMTGRGAKASARVREQQRIGAILGHAAAANNLPLAVSLAVETRMTRGEAIAVLKGQAGRRRDDDDDAPVNRHARSNRVDRNVTLGGDAPKQNDKKALASSWDAAFQRAGIATTTR